MSQESQYQPLVDSFYKVFKAPAEQADEQIKVALKLSAGFDDRTVVKAKQEAAVMAVMDSQFQA
jgi:hypothetical protein